MDNAFRKEYGKYELANFEFESGKSIDNVVVEYCLWGCPKYDDGGNISNAVVFSHRFYHNCLSIDEFSNFTKKGGPLDLNEFFIVSITSFGCPESCSPSTTDLKHQFPQYTIKDMVNFKKRFLKEFLSIEKIQGLLGVGLGGYEVLTWAVSYPDDMEFIIVLNSSYKTNGYRYVVSKCINGIIESNDDFYNDIYDESLSKVMVSVNQVVYSNYFSKNTFQAMSNHEIDVMMEEFVNAGLSIDIYDLKFYNDSILKYNLEKELKNIKAKSLIIGSSDNLFHSSKFDSIPLSNSISNSKLVLFDSKRDYTDIEDYSPFEKELSEFLEEFKK